MNDVIAFAHIYKCAGTTFKSILRRNFGARHFDTGMLKDNRVMDATQMQRLRWIYPRLASIAGHEVRSFSDLGVALPGIRYYTFIREPRRRAISALRAKTAYRIADDGWSPASTADVEDWVRTFLPRQKNHLCGAFAASRRLDEARERFDSDIGFVGAVEQFDVSLALFREWVGVPDLDIRYTRLNAASARTTAHGRFRPVAQAMTAADASVADIVRQPRVADLLEAVTEDDRRLYDHALGTVFRAQVDRSTVDNLSGLRFDVPDRLPDNPSGKLHRALVGRRLAPLLGRRDPWSDP